MKKNSRRKYDPDFKRNAVLLCIEQGRSVAEVADNLGINRDILYHWRSKYNKANGLLAFPGNGIEALTPDQKRIRELEKELKDTVMERDILKKAMAIFSRASK
ncbi:MAG: transposase [Desulfobacteraceae bacterium]|nr:transposase [Desulfobacteraceae bacterium]